MIDIRNLSLPINSYAIDTPAESTTSINREKNKAIGAPNFSIDNSCNCKKPESNLPQPSEDINLKIIQLLLKIITQLSSSISNAQPSKSNNQCHEKAEPPSDATVGDCGSQVNEANQANTDGIDIPSDNGAELGPGATSALRQFTDEIKTASQATGIPSSLLAAMMWAESRGDRGATATNPGNGQTDTGLMQVNPTTFRGLQEMHPEFLDGKDISDPSTNIMAAALLMKDLKGKFGDWEPALRGYNSGEDAVDPTNPHVAKNGIGDPKYVKNVMNYWHTISSGGQLPP